MLIVGSILVTVFGLNALGGWNVLREIAGSEMFNLWKPLVPEGVIGTWMPVKDVDVTGRVVRQAWYFNDNYTFNDFKRIFFNNFFIPVPCNGCGQ